MREIKGYEQSVIEGFGGGNLRLLEPSDFKELKINDIVVYKGNIMKIIAIDKEMHTIDVKLVK